MSSSQVYSATYSNVPVFEFVTPEGSIMRRKLDSWINATHILKIAKFPKAKRTRILEKDVQTGVHEKVQGGYGKYQGTYVPLELGADIAREFGVFEILRPIFEFKYIEGESETPPPAPKHSHASALNLAKRQNSINDNGNIGGSVVAKKQKGTVVLNDQQPRKRGRPRRVALPTTNERSMTRLDNTSFESGPSIGTFNNKTPFVQLSKPSSHYLPSLSRQDTERDSILSSTASLKNEDLQLVESDDEGEETPTKNDDIHMVSNELLTGKELFGPQSFENLLKGNGNLPALTSRNSSIDHQNDPYSLPRYHSISIKNEDQIFSDYFTSLLTHFLDDSKVRSIILPEYLASPPQPLSKIGIDRAIDNDGNSLFHWACSMANIVMIEFLLKTFEISPDIRNNNSETPLMFMIKFSNSYQLRNFASILEFLWESVLSMDNTGKTILHHIACLDTDKKSKGDYTRYYLETIFDKMVGSLEEQEDVQDSKDLIYKFVNHQDSDGNSAFHIAAYGLQKQFIKVFIKHHKYIDFSLRNLVSYTVEDYLASHNFVLRLDQSSKNPGDETCILTGTPLSYSVGASAANIGTSSSGLVTDVSASEFVMANGFKSQTHSTKIAVRLQNNAFSVLTEKFADLGHAIEKELNQKDDIIHSFYKVLEVISKEKFESQKEILKFFHLEYLVDDLERGLQEASQHKVALDVDKDEIIQEEIARLANDLCFQYLQKKDELDDLWKRYKLQNQQAIASEVILHAETSKEMENDFVAVNPVNDGAMDRLALATELTQCMIEKKLLMDKLNLKQVELSRYVSFSKATAEDSAMGDFEHTNGDFPSAPFNKAHHYPATDQAGARSVSDKENAGNGGEENIYTIGQTDRLAKYSKLISLCCGMDASEVERSIEIIEQSLLASRRDNIQ